MNRSKWNRRSMPYGFEYYSDFEDTGYSTESSLPLFLEEQEFRRTIVYQGRKNKPVSEEKSPSVELSTDQYSPGVLKIYGDTIFPGVEYKSVLASYRSTAQELVKQALERYGLSPKLCKEYVLCDVVGICNQTIPERNGIKTGGNSLKWQRLCTRTLSDYDKPLLLQNFWLPAETYSRRYELRLKSEFTINVNNDDTQGINENARKICISKLRPGAIPFFTSWEQDKLDRFADELNLEGTLSRSNTPKWKSQQSENDDFIGSLNLDIGLTSPGSRSPISLPQNKLVEYFMAPTTRPFLLTLRGCDVNRDSVFHVIENKTILVCNAQSCLYDTPSIGLFSDDISAKHCYLHLKRTSHVKKSNSQKQLYNYCLEVECTSASNVKVNGYQVTRKTTIYSGDILAMGTRYLFLFKDLTAGHEIPLELSWLYSEDKHERREMIREENGIRIAEFQNNGNVSELMLGQNEMMEDSMSVSTMGSNMESSRDKFRFAFSREKEDELIIDIGAVVRQNYVDLPLTPAYIYCMCVEYACRTYEAHQLKKLLLRILATVRENVSDLSKALSASKHNCGIFKSRRHPTQINEDFLRYMIQWMSNAVQMILYLRGGNFRLDRVNKKAIDDPRNLFSDLATGLEEIVIYCFQQTIYTVTKALYSYLPEILDSNPFSEVEPDRKSGMGKLIGVFNYVAKLTSTQFLHIDVGKQIFMYLFFFCSTSVFNRLLLKDSGHNYYNWPSGVRIRANLGILEDWATRNGLDEEFGHLFEKLLSAAELLSTSKNLLLKYDWMSMRRHFHPLNEAQLYRLLSQYDLAGKSFPKIWRPLPEDKFLARQEENIMLEMSQHPPFLIPQDVSIIDLVNPPDNPGFWAFFKQLHAQFGIHEDESDSGISPNTTPRFTGNFPNVELQKSFFRQGSNPGKATKKTTATKSKHSPTSARTNRRVQFASANEAEGRQNSPRDYDPNENRQEPLSEYDCETGSDVTDMSHDHRNNNVTNQNSHSAISNCQSADYRLDLLINSSGTNLPSEVKKETQIVHNRHTSPPPLPPRGTKTVCNGSDTENSTTSSIPPTKTRMAVKHIDSEYKKEDIKLNINKSDILDANGITNDLLYELNNENMEGKKKKSLNTDLSSTSSDGTPIIFNNLNSPPTSPSEKNSNLPVYTVTIAKGDKGLGLGLIDGLYTPLRLAGIYIRKILPESPAADGGQLHVGDRILSVNNKSIIGADYQSAMKLIRAAGENLTLIVAKGNHSVATKISSTSC